MSTDPTERRAAVPIEDQIAELEREVAMRRQVYPNLVIGRKLSQAKADQQIATMQAAAASLRWLAANREWIHEAHAERRERRHWQDERARRDPAVQAVQEAFPGAQVVSVRPMEDA